MNLELIREARERIKDGIYRSPCEESIPLSEISGTRLYCKLDYLQRTGSFKERGARNALLLLDDQQKSQGVIAASAGNHALGLAYHGKLLGIPVTVVMPRFAPIVKMNTCRQMGANVILHGENFSEAFAHAHKLAEEKGFTYIDGFNRESIIAGQGTMGLEICEQIPDFDAVVLPLGGGGLAAGVCTAIRALKPDVKFYGVEPENAASFTLALQKGGPDAFPLAPTLADGLAVGTVGPDAFRIAAPLLEKVVLVNEDEISLAILRIAELEKSVVEGAAASTLAALITGKLPELKDQKVVVPLCGGNLDMSVLGRIIDRGMVTDGRLCRFIAVISDRPGGLQHLAEIIAGLGASVKDIFHERTFTHTSLAEVSVVCTVETRDHEQVEALLARLTEKGIPYFIPSAFAKATAGATTIDYIERGH